MIILHNNKFVKKALVDATGPFSRGEGIFETLRVVNKKAVLLKMHLDRFFYSAKKINLKIKYSREEILKMFERVIKKSPHKAQRVKIIATSSDIIVTSIKTKINKKIYSGISMKSTNLQRSMPEIKSMSHLTSFLAHENAVKAGFFDALLIDDNNEVYEGAYSNIFWFEKDTLCTRKNKVLPGITREIILKNTKFKTKFKTIKLQDLKKQKEIFLTQSITLVVPITKIDTTKINNGKIGDNTKTIMKEINSLLSS
ncbi:MAG: aminotransferase class IV [Candidatus Peregrinibacteria bacterium]|nr:aminotransferase class IV [Candidatus Peregrinibacteria bacterium]